MPDTKQTYEHLFAVKEKAPGLFKKFLMFFYEYQKVDFKPSESNKIFQDISEKIALLERDGGRTAPIDYVWSSGTVGKGRIIGATIRSDSLEAEIGYDDPYPESAAVAEMWLKVNFKPEEVTTANNREYEELSSIVKEFNFCYYS